MEVTNMNMQASMCILVRLVMTEKEEAKVFNNFFASFFISDYTQLLSIWF